MRSGTILLGLSFLLSKILGLIRENMLAAQFGASGGGGNPLYNLDTYFAAFRLPDLLFNLLSYGVLSAAFVPIFVEILKKENLKAAFKFSNETLHTVVAIILVFSGVLFILAPYFLKIFVPGFAEKDFEVTVTLTRLMLITPFFFTIGSIFGGIQNSLHKFAGLALAPVFYNLGIILGIVFFSKQYGVYGVALGVAVGAFLNMAIQLPTVFKAGFRYVWPKVWWTARVKEMVMLALPRIFGMSVTQLSLVIDTIIASTLAAGSITIINFAANLETLPVGIVGISVAIVSFGTLSAHAAENNIVAFKKDVTDNVRRILFLLIPTTFGMLTLRVQIVRLLLGRGKFGWTDTVLTANTLGIFLSGLAFGGIVFLLARAFYALKDTKTPVIIGIIAVIANIAFSLTFTKIWQLNTYGLALSNAIANIINATLLVILLSKKLKSSVLDTMEVLKFIFGAIFMTVVVQLTKSSFSYVFEEIDTYTELTIQTLGSIAAGVAAYGLTCFLFRCKDRYFWRNKKILTP